MPRITFNEFSRRRQQLKKAWDDPRSPFLSLDTHEQWDLHDYYCPGMELSAEELKVWWKSLHKTPTSLHQQAGRAYTKLEPYLEGKPYYLVTPERRATSNKNARVVVRGMIDPEINVELMTGAVMMLVRELTKEVKKTRQKKEDTGRVSFLD